MDTPFPNPKLADQLNDYLEAVGNDACNAESDELWRLYNAIQDTQRYLCGQQQQPDEPPPWKL